MNRDTHHFIDNTQMMDVPVIRQFQVQP